MALAPQHTFQVLTKRHARMRALLSRSDFPVLMDNYIYKECVFEWPLPNVWLGISVENQQWADVRIPALMETPAAVRFLSCEPLLGPIQLTRLHAHCPTHDSPGGFCTGGCPDLRIPDWIITGGESGPGARPAHPDWFRSLRDQSQALGIAFLHKQNGEWVSAAYGTHVGLRPEAEWHRADIRPQEHWFPTPAPDEPRLTHAIVQRVGKKAAGRELDGRTWDEYPGEAGRHCA
jgi:protein gp37